MMGVRRGGEGLDLKIAMGNLVVVGWCEGRRGCEH